MLYITAVVDSSHPPGENQTNNVTAEGKKSNIKIECFTQYQNILNKYKKRLLPSCIHHFKSDLINNMDHMRISGTEPSSVIRSQTKWFQKLKIDAQKVPKQAKAKRDG